MKNWWGFKHIDGGVVVLPYSSTKQIKHTHDSLFCTSVVLPFPASGRSAAMRRVKAMMGVSG